MNVPNFSENLIRFLEPESLRNRWELLTEAERSVLEQVNQGVAAEENVDRMIDLVFDATLDRAPCDRIGVAFTEEDGHRIRAYYCRARYEPMLLGKGYAEDLRGSSLEGVIDTGRVRLIHDLVGYLERRPTSASTSLLVREGVRSSMTCPLTVHGRHVGVLFRSARIANAYSEREVVMHLAVAERLAQAVEKARQIERLEAANRAYTEMLGFVSHELKSPLASIVMDSDAMTAGYLGEMDDTIREKISRIGGKASYLLSLVREYLDLARLEGGQMAPRLERNADLKTLVFDRAWNVVRADFETHGMRLVWRMPENELRLTCDPDLLQVVMVNLLGNAVKYGKEGGEVRLEARWVGTTLRIVVWNEGPGFSPDERHKLFQKFSRLDAPELRRQPGTGVGLYTAWRLVQLHNGSIRAESQPGEWASFTIELPGGPEDFERPLMGAGK